MPYFGKKWQYKTLKYCTPHCNILQHTAENCSTLQHFAEHILLFTLADSGSATLYNTLLHTATHCNTLQHTATHCNTLYVLLWRTVVVQKGVVEENVIEPPHPSRLHVYIYICTCRNKEIHIHICVHVNMHMYTDAHFWCQKEMSDKIS